MASSSVEVAEQPLKMEEEMLEGQELTNKYLSGELSFSEYAGMLASEDADLSDPDVDMESDDEEDDSSTSGKQGEGVELAAPTGGERPPGRRRRRKRLLKRRALPAVLQGMMGEANLRFARGDKDDAESICKEIIRQCPLAPEPFQLMAMMYEERGDVERALQYSLIAAHLSRPDADEWMRLAKISEQKENYKQVVICITNALKAAPYRLDLHMKRVEAWNNSGRNERGTIPFFKRAVSLMIQVCAADAFRVMKELHHLLLSFKLLDDAKEYWSKVFAAHGMAASWEDTHLYLELLLTTGSHSQCVSALVKFCGVRFIPDLDLEQDVPAQMAQVTGVSVPEGVPLDVKYKLLLALIHLGCLPLAEKHLIPSLKTCDPETYGDIYLDVAEALMERKQYDEALNLLNILTATENFSLAGIWLRVGEALNESGRPEDAVAAYQEVMQRAPHHSEARLVLSHILHGLGRREQAISVLSQEEQQEELDSELLLKKCDLLEKGGLIEEFIDTVRTLLSQHCPIIRSRDEAKSMLVGFKVRENTLKQLRKWKSDHQAAKEPIFVDRPTELERHWELFGKTLVYLEQREQYADCVDLIIRAKGSKEFDRRSDIAKSLDTMCAISCFKAADYEIGFPVVRRMLLADPEVPALWNLLNLVTMRAEDIRHARFLMRLTHRLPDLVALSLLNGHNCLMSGTYKYALVEYATAYKMAPDDPLIALLVGVTFIHLAAQKFTVRKHSLVVQAQAFLGLYVSLRGETQESYYNMARGMHELGLLPNAVHYYKKALALDPPSGEESLDLRREVAYNLSLIYRNSGNLTLARRVTHQYCVI